MNTRRMAGVPMFRLAVYSITTNIATTTTYFVGIHYEVANGVVAKYYYAGSQRIAMRANGTLNYQLGDHLGSTSLTTDATGQVVSELRYSAWGEVRYASGDTPTKYTYTGQYSYTSEFGLHFYNARWYDSSLGRFAQADSIISGAGNPQAWDRYAYANNNPLYYTDPSGHVAIDGDNNSRGGIYCYPGELACELMKSGYKQKSKEEIARDLRFERPVSGLHLGGSAQNGFLKDKGGYYQEDYLLDWKNGVFYRMITVGAYDAIGTPSGKVVTGYGGWTTVHGISLYGEDDISSPLAGTNIDGAISVGGDAGVKLSATKGLSVDVDDSLQPIYTGSGLIGYQYAVETTLEIGGNIVPNEIDFSGEAGVSASWIKYRYEIPWWPFR